tara:strand:+ start:36 stop:911 length:876 start_codon:yes stop_codon:yes gene_type:complete
MKVNSKVLFIVVGWYYNQKDWNDGLYDLKESHDDVEVFWVCHKEPPQHIKDRFNWKLFPNGEEFVAYEQAIEYLDISDETICFFVHDDMIPKKWDFIGVCINAIENHGIKAIGNGVSYPMEFDPDEKDTSIHLSEEIKKYTKNPAIFDRKMWIKTLRGSFMCMKYKDLKLIDGFEPSVSVREEISVNRMYVIEEECCIDWDENHYSDWNGDIDDCPKPYHHAKEGSGYYKREDGKIEKITGYGNCVLIMFSYKINRMFGSDSITYLSDRYLDSDYIYEMGRGGIDPDNPIT